MEKKGTDTLFSRAEGAGYDPATVARARFLIVGVGAIGSNALQSLVLSGASDVLVCDMDTAVERVNLPHSPLFRGSDVGRPKAEVAATRAAACAPGGSCRAGYAVGRFESLGHGVLEGVAVVIAAVDSMEARANIADAARRARVPLVEAGFDGTTVHVTAWSNQTADAPCFQCLHGEAGRGRASCDLYAKRLIAAGFLPAIQSAAATAGALTAEAAIGAVHGRFPLDEHYLEIDVRTGRSTRFRVSRRRHCPGAHHVLVPAKETGVDPSQNARRLFQTGVVDIEERIVLPGPYLVAAPCYLCGCRVPIGAPLETAPEPDCRACDGRACDEVALVELAHEIGVGDAHTEHLLSRLGFGARDLVRVRRGDTIRAIRLAGDAESTWERVDADSTVTGAPDAA